MGVGGVGQLRARELLHFWLSDGSLVGWSSGQKGERNLL